MPEPLIAITYFQVIIHPHYHAPSLRNDIALIILDAPFKLTENVGLACLPKERRQMDNNKCIATGWGKNSYKKETYQSILKKIELPIVSRDVCLRALQKARLGPFFNLHKSFICAGGEENKDTCKGDGGSPLMCPVVDQPGRYEQVGIVSWGLTCGIQNTPGVYVNIDLFRPWIDHVMKSQDFDTNVYKY
ncbi:hypothetical protein NQ314_002130 [Rhamnusium bicolor]|uniref:Peptidase S1 domain-containing protein n=1 Tax=Rhamnusium bicolor TaxID=1586634 RepID=A0AAV8ZSC7_9CUCU|nr:hypothetical protein NQ314_002130 [Rhamnusium bicolor]